MKKKKLFSRVLAVALTLSLMLATFPRFSVFAQEVLSKEQLSEKSELWQPESSPNELNFEGDLSIEELQNAKLDKQDTPEIVGQENIEEKGHVNRLWEQEEDLNSIVFQNRDGTKTMYYYNYPVKYKDVNGKIRDKSNKISQTSGGDYTNAENDINTYFPKKLNRNKGIELKFGEYVVEMAPNIKGNSGASRQTGHNKYFDPTGYVQYPNVFDESISLRYTPTFEGYKEDIVLSKYAGINEFSFRLYTDGLSLVMNEDGTYYLIDPLSGVVKTQIGDLVVYDSKPFDVPEEILNESVSNPTEEDFAKKEATLKELIESVPIDKNATDELPNTPNKYFHQYKVETVRQDNEYLITVVVDEEYLTDSERVYPVYVDPTISVSGSGTGKTIQDAPIYANKPSTASGGNTYNVVGYQGSTYGVGRTLMKFPGLSSNSTYANLSSNQITSLQLHIYEGSGSTNNACIDLWQYNGTSWTESTARCNNVGWDSYSNNFTWNYINCSGWQTFDLTSMVATWKSSSTALNKGIMLKNYTSESSSGYSKHFLSTESSYKPYLTYTYVTNIPVSQVCLEPSSLSLNVNDTYYLDGSVVPYNATNKTIYYESSNTSVATVGYTSGLVCASSPGTTTITARSADGGHVAYCSLTVRSTDPFHPSNVQYARYTRITGKNYWGLGSSTDHTISILKSSRYSYDYYIAHDNINGGYSREYAITADLKNTLNNLETQYQEHYNIIPGLNTTSDEERAAHSAKLETDQLVESGHVTKNSSEYYGTWAYNYTSTLNLGNYWRGVIDTATAAYGVYLTITSCYYSYLSSTATTSTSLSSTQYKNTASYLDDIDDAMNGMSFNNKKVISAEERNLSLKGQGYTNPYEAGTPVVKFSQSSTTQYVRVYTSGATQPAGKWIMKYSDIQGLTPAQIQSKFALPNTPTHYCFVNVPSGTQMYAGIVGENYGYTAGQAVQFELGANIPTESFGSGIPLP